MSGLPNTIIMDIIREATTAGLMDYWTERAPVPVWMGVPRERAMERTFISRYGAGACERESGKKRVEWKAVKAKSALNAEFYSQIPLDDLDDEYEKYDFQYEGDNDINGGLYLVVGGFLSECCEWVNDDNYFNVDVDEIFLNHPLRE